MTDRVRIVEGLVGERSGTGRLFVDGRNYLTASTQPTKARPLEVPLVDLAILTNDAEVDLLKLDVEGSEFSFVRHNRAFLSKVRFLVAEIHPELGSHEELVEQLKTAGLSLVEAPTYSNGQILASYASRDASRTSPSMGKGV